MKVLLCHNYYQRPGGEDQVFHDERRLLEEHGHEVAVYTKHNDSVAEMSRAQLVKDTFWNQATYDELSELITQLQPDVMHCTNVFPLISPAAYSAARDHGVPVIQSLHNYRLFCANGYFLRNGQVCEDCVGRWFAWPAVQHACYRDSRSASLVVAGMQTFHRRRRTWAKFVDHFISCSEFARRKLIQSGMPADRITVKPNFVHPDTGIGTGEGGYAIFVGRLSAEKGITTLLEAWSRFDDPIPLKIIGDGPLMSQIAAAAQTDRRIECLGWQPLEQVLSLVGSASFLVMPSVWYETFGRTIIEAFSKGTPVIVSELGAMAELVVDQCTGLLFEPGNAEQLAAKVVRLWSDESLRRRMRPLCRAEFECKYTAAENYRQLLEIYEGVAGSNIAPQIQVPECAPA